MSAHDFAIAARDLGFELDGSALNRFRRYRDLMIEAAESFSLTAVRDAEAIERRHFLEALALGRVLDDQGLLAVRSRVLDIGSGAGLPGLPLKIVRPDLQMALLEANGKRCRFLRQTIEALGLEDVEVVEGRAETFAREPRHREAYDLVAARAVAPLPVLIEYALPFLRAGGHLAATKGSAATREIESSERALAELGGEFLSALPFDPPAGLTQTIVVVRKTAPTPERYPRRVGIASKRPLL